MTYHQTDTISLRKIPRWFREDVHPQRKSCLILNASCLESRSSPGHPILSQPSWGIQSQGEERVQDWRGRGRRCIHGSDNLLLYNDDSDAHNLDATKDPEADVTSGDELADDDVLRSTRKRKGSTLANLAPTMAKTITSPSTVIDLVEKKKPGRPIKLADS